jgi:Flp pilus assembly protein TadG
MKNRGIANHRRMKMNTDQQGGQALIELAISLPLLFLLLLGAAEFGRLAYMAIEVADAAKAAAQFAALDETTMQDTAGILVTAQNNAPYVTNFCTSFTATAVNPVKCTCMTSGTPNPTTPTSAACIAGSCASPGYIAHVVQVTTTASCSPIFHATGFSGANITLNGSAVQEVLY